MGQIGELIAGFQGLGRLAQGLFGVSFGFCDDPGLGKVITVPFVQALIVQIRMGAGRPLDIESIAALQRGICGLGADRHLVFQGHHRQHPRHHGRVDERDANGRQELQDGDEPHAADEDVESVVPPERERAA